MRRFVPPNLLAAMWRFYCRTEQAEPDLIAAEVAFYGFLAIFPAAAAVIAIWGFVSDPDVIRQELNLLRPVLPPDVFTLIADQVEGLMSVASSNLGLTTVLSTASALWSARAGMAALIRGLNAIHQRPNRSGHWHQLRAVALTFVLLGLVLAVILPLVMAFLPLGSYGLAALQGANTALGLGLGVLAMALAYRLGPNHGKNPPPLLSWGLLVAVVLWVLATRGFMLYLDNFPSYNRIYGSIGAVAALMMWLYVSAYTVLLGAAVDAERHRAARQ
ncbi:MAG: YihY/virulence factor BrkB family protein [Alphaproteobacteria bacterium]|nr:YihY/virulence factor BrkB family protein [Alphaproteobacteria bacterium]